MDGLFFVRGEGISGTHVVLEGTDSRRTICGLTPPRAVAEQRPDGTWKWSGGWEYVEFWAAERDLCARCMKAWKDSRKKRQ